MSDDLSNRINEAVDIFGGTLHGDFLVEVREGIERLRAALTAMLFVTEQLCETLDVDTYETYIRVKKGKSGETIARRSVAEIVQAGHDALGEEKK
jgi:hypothetical protein